MPRSSRSFTLLPMPMANIVILFRLARRASITVFPRLDDCPSVSTMPICSRHYNLVVDYHLRSMVIIMEAFIMVNVYLIRHFVCTLYRTIMHLEILELSCKEHIITLATPSLPPCFFENMRLRMCQRASPVLVEYPYSCFISLTASMTSSRVK